MLVWSGRVLHSYSLVQIAVVLVVFSQRPSDHIGKITFSE